MNPFSLSLAYLKDRALNTALNVLLLALGVATLVILVLFSAQLEGRFARDAEGVDLVVGAKGSPLQLILSSVYHVDVPTGNVPLATMALLRRDPTVAQVIPMALGDAFRTFRIVGTEPAYATHHGAALAAGRMFAAPMEAVLGAEAARVTGARAGQRFVGSHGVGGSGEGHQDHAERPFTVVGVLKPTGTVIDRLILTPVESVWDVHGIEHEHEKHEGEGHEGEAHEHEAAGHDHDAAPAVIGARPAEMAPDLTALLVRYRSPLAAIRLPAFINAQPGLQAAVPAIEITRLLQLLGVGLDAARAFAVLLIATAGLSIFVALYSSLRQREGDISMLRVMGAKPAAIFGQVLTEGLLMAAAGAALGVALGHSVILLAARAYPELGQLGLSAARFQPAEATIVLGALALGAVAALIPALRVFRVDIARTLAHAS